MSADDFTKIRVGDDVIGIMGLRQAIEQIASSHSDKSDQKVELALMERLGTKNYIAESAREEYGKAFVREFRKFLGQPYEESSRGSMSIVVLGTGCSECYRLKQSVMQVLMENDLSASLEHVTDIKEIAKYGVVRTPALIVNGRVMSAGIVPSTKKIKELIG